MNQSVPLLKEIATKSEMNQIVEQKEEEEEEEEESMG